MKFPIPGFVPVPAPEVLRIISYISLAVGICLVCAGLLCLFSGKKAGKNRLGLAFIGTGALLAVNHGLQLLF